MRTARSWAWAAPAPGRPSFPQLSKPLKDINHPIGKDPGIHRLAVILIEPTAVIAIRQAWRPGQPRQDLVPHAQPRPPSPDTDCCR